MPEFLTKELLVLLVIVLAAGITLAHTFLKDANTWPKAFAGIAAVLVCGAAVFFEKFDDCDRYACVTGWAKQPEPTVMIEARSSAGGRAQSTTDSAGTRTGPAIHVPVVIEVRTETPKPTVDPAPVVAPPKPAKPAKPQLVEKGDPICPEGFSCSPQSGKRAPEREPPKMVAAWSGLPPPAAVPAVDPLAGLKASLKGELRRLNCLKGGDEASWGKDAVSAINRFNVYGYTKASVEPDEETLQMLKSVKEPVCP